MTTGRSNIVDVSLEYRTENGAGTAAAFFQGDHDDDNREVWVWLPRSQIEIEGEEKRGALCEVSLPEWLAQEKGLI